MGAQGGARAGMEGAGLAGKQMRGPAAGASGRRGTSIAHSWIGSKRAAPSQGRRARGERGGAPGAPAGRPSGQGALSQQDQAGCSRARRSLSLARVPERRSPPLPPPPPRVQHPKTLPSALVGPGQPLGPAALRPSAQRRPRPASRSARPANASAGVVAGLGTPPARPARPSQQRAAADRPLRRPAAADLAAAGASERRSSGRRAGGSGASAPP